MQFKQSMAKQDLTKYSDSELSLIVFNDETLYRMRNRRGFIETLREIFIFSESQLDELNQDLEDERNEESQNETKE